MGLKTLNVGQRADLERRFRNTATRVDSMEDRMNELKERLKGQMSVAFSLIAQEDSKASISIANKQSFIAEMAAADSRVMRTIGVLTLVFLPSTLVTVSL
ncbi:uncharacterized protein DNG_07932 [Cephalotrichum gorgonifer]|uniref:Uncharacterized protein n=1 Tax=Cephalotrichum gorgonifer TaxID=2041049 RepID=A0AAE8N5M6_9PEZI|nr:uncharacterized protein DNG_07932 [Cephalotrichum gorgonifer]